MKSTLNFLSLSPILSSSSKHPFANPNLQTMSLTSPCKPLQNQETFLIRRRSFKPVIKGHRLARFLSADSVNGGNSDSMDDDFWLYSTLSVSILTQFQFLPVRAKARQYRSETMNLTKNSTESISEYLFRIKILVDSLAVAERPVKLQEHVDAILLGLPEEYEGVVIFIYAMSMGDPFTVEQIEYLLWVYEAWIDEYF